MQCVLIVDDEPLVLALAERILARAGYRTYVRVGGASALQFISEHEGCVDILLTDVRMPDVHGARVAKAARSKWPSTRIVYMSGYCGTADESAALRGADWFLQKPFTRARLLEAMSPTARPTDGISPSSPQFA